MKKLTEEKIYIYLALIFGILFVFLTPPFLSPDEDTHFLKSYSVSRGLAYPKAKKKNLGNYFPKEMLKEINEKLEFNNDMKEKYSYLDYFNEQFDQLNYQKKKFLSYSTQSMFPLAYLAPAVGIIFSKFMSFIFNLDYTSVSYMLQFARVFSLILSVSIIYLAIKTTPILKKLMMASALIPTSLFLCSMVTYDSILISCTLLAIAVMLKLICDKKEKKITKKDIIILILTGLILLNVKIIYSFIFVLLFFVPKEKFNGQKNKYKMLFIIAAVILLLTAIFKLPTYFTSVKPAANPKIAAQYNFIFKHPFKYLGYIKDNLIRKRLFFINTMFGGFGLLDTYLPLALVSAYILFLPILAVSESSTDKYVINIKMKLVYFIGIVLCVIGIFTAMYTGWTILFFPIGSQDIAGVQGRYFLPLALPSMMLLTSHKLKDNKIFKIVRDNYFIIPTIALSVSIAFILLRFWV